MFKIGDVVNLNSGGPDMTVVEINSKAPNGSIRCTWFKDEVMSVDYGYFPLESLSKRKEVGYPS